MYCEDLLFLWNGGDGDVRYVWDPINVGNKNVIHVGRDKGQMKVLRVLESTCCLGGKKDIF